MNKSPLLEKVLEEFQKAADKRKPYEARWRRFYDIYRCRAKPHEDETRANVFVPEVFTIIETLSPRLLSKFLNNSGPVVKVLGREESDLKNARAAEQLITYQFERMQLPVKLVSFYKQALLYGSSVGKIFWDYRTAKDRNGDTRVVYDDPVFEPLDLFDFYIDPLASSIDDARYCIHRKYLSLKELKKREEAGIYRNVNDIKGGQGKTSIIDDQPIFNQHDLISNEDRNIEILEYWEDNRVITVADRSVILREAPNPFDHMKKPFVNLIFVPVPFEFYGIGVIEPLEGLQMELNTKRNQRLDNVNLIINRMWLLQRGALDDLRQLHSRPGGVIVVNDINGIQSLPSPDVTSSSYQEEEKIKLDIQNTSGVSDYIRGVVNYTKQTATEVSIKSEQSSNRFEFNFKLMAEMGVKNIAQQVIQMDQQFIDRERTIRILGDRGVEFVQIFPDDIAGNFDLIPCIDPLGIQEKDKKDQMMSLYDRLMQNPIIDKKLLSRKLLETFDFPDTEEILTGSSDQDLSCQPPGKLRK